MDVQRRLALSAVALAATLPLVPQAAAQAWPSRPISDVVPFTPGGTTDVVGCAITQGIAPALGQPVVVDNKPGAAGANRGVRSNVSDCASSMPTPVPD